MERHRRWRALPSRIWSIGLGIMLTIFATQGAAVEHYSQELGLYRPQKPVTVPSFRLQSLDGNTVTLEDLRGKIVFLNFWATWCPPCRAEMPAMERLFQRMQGKDFVMLGINLQESREQVQGFMERFQLHFPVLLDSDGTVSDAYRITGIPTTYILNGKGEVVAQAIGPRAWDSEVAYAFFDQLLPKSTIEVRRAP